jgi:cobalt/nickel transport system permease protein
MHIPDGFLSTPVWAGLAVASAPAVTLAARRAGLEDARVPLMGVLGAVVFAAQMINFPVGVGASGHLLGSTLLTVVLGPAPAIVVMTAILAIQALIFQDGGLLALGANVFNMALAGVAAAHLATRLLRGRAGVFVGGFLSVAVAGWLCLGELALSGVRLRAEVLLLALAVFSVAALVEGAITVSVLGALERINPSWLAAPAERRRPAVAALALAALVLGAAGFLLASALPDGLERVAGLVGLEERARVVLHAPLADYQVARLADPWLRKAVAGLCGLLVTCGLCFAAGRWLRRPAE